MEQFNINDRFDMAFRAELKWKVSPIALLDPLQSNDPDKKLVGRNAGIPAPQGWPGKARVQDGAGGLL